MSERVPRALARLVRVRARRHCEYCLFVEEDTAYYFGVDHIVARKHGGRMNEANLAWACFACNVFKGTDIASVDLETGRIDRLFNPRKDRWSRHFQLEGPRIVPRTAIGRVTEQLLQFNRPEAIPPREMLIADGLYPR